jgi:spoIIIJ-associated protein
MTITVEAKSLQLALLKAAGQLGITQSDLGYKIIKEHNGLWGLFGKKVSIEAWVVVKGKDRNASRRGSSAAQSAIPLNRERSSRDGARPSAPRPPQPPRRSERPLREQRAPREERHDREHEGDSREPAVPRVPLTTEEITALKADLQKFCAGLCQQISGEACTVTVSDEDDRLVFAVTSAAIAEALSKNMKFVEAIEHLIRKKPKDLHQELPFRIYVDINGVRQQRQEELATMARDLSDKVFENKRPIVLNYRSSYDRKIIHMALDKDERVYTKSIGNGPNRKLMILPVRQQNQEVGAR